MNRSRNTRNWRYTAIMMLRRSLRAAGRSTGLLYDVSQLMRQKLPARARARRKLSIAEDHVRSHRVGQCMDRTRRRRGLGIGMHAHVGKIMSETSSEETPRRRIQRLSRRIQHAAHRRRSIQSARGARRRASLPDQRRPR